MAARRPRSAPEVNIQAAARNGGAERRAGSFGTQKNRRKGQREGFETSHEARDKLRASLCRAFPMSEGRRRARGIEENETHEEVGRQRGRSEPCVAGIQSRKKDADAEEAASRREPGKKVVLQASEALQQVNGEPSGEKESWRGAVSPRQKK